MSRWGNAKERDMNKPVLIYSRVPAFTVQHGGVFFEIPRGVSVQYPHLAERLVAKYRGDIFYGDSDPNHTYAPDPEPVEETKPEPAESGSSADAETEVAEKDE